MESLGNFPKGLAESLCSACKRVRLHLLAEALRRNDTLRAGYGARRDAGVAFAPLRLVRLHVGGEGLFLDLELQHHLRDQFGGGLLPEEAL